MRKRTSTCEASSLGSSHLAPRSRRGWAFSWVRVYTERLKLALIRCLHMLTPMTPVPIQPILSPFMINRYNTFNIFISI